MEKGQVSNSGWRSPPESQSLIYLQGFHALTTKEFAEAFQTILTLSPDEEASMRWRARAWAVQRFSEEEFERGWNQSGWRNYLPSQ